MKKKSIVALLGLALLVVSGVLLAKGSNWTSLLSKDVMRILPETQDFRNYFFLQSIDDTTIILIGDFSGAEEIFVQIIDNNSDNAIDAVYEYYPQTKRFKVLSNTSSSKFFTTNIAQLKRDIISGSIFRTNYSYQMKSIDILRNIIQAGIDIHPDERGFVARYIDPDLKSQPMAEFYFRKEFGRYDLQFKTNYYKIFRLEVHPVPPYSVYCRNSKDPVVVETVESLLKEMK